jgi:hypothetical protein
LVNDGASDFVISASGRVGIGRLSPASPLEVYGAGFEAALTLTTAEDSSR